MTYSNIAVASSNQGKITEFQHFFSKHNITLASQGLFIDDAIEETGTSFIENALIKANYLATYTSFPVLADDSGLVVPALGGEPGVYSARYAEVEPYDEISNIHKLLLKMQPLTKAQRSAYFHCSLVLLRYVNDPEPIIAQANCYGTISLTAKGKNGFGYDPVFIPEDYKLTFAELDANVKQQKSHRALALERLLSKLQQT